MIAVYVNESGVTARPGEKGFVRIYEQLKSKWSISMEVPFEPEANSTIAGIRHNLQEMVQKLEGCKVFVANQVAGQLYYVLEAHGFESFEAEGEPEEFLDSIHETVKQDKSVEEPSSAPKSYFIKQEEEGAYFVDLKSALNMDCSLTSKKLLMPFLKKGEFKRLEVLCDHLPRWFESELAPMKLKMTVVKANEKESRVFIFKE